MDRNLLKKLQEENQQLSRQANYDELTGLLNRRASEQQISQILSEGGALLVGDLDHFKSINDRFGHQEGDRYLQKAAQLLSSVIRGGDIVGRVGGDEFVIFLANCTQASGVSSFISRVNQKFQSSNRGNTNGIQLSITIGNAIFQPGDTYETLFHRADQLLLTLKDLQRGNRSLPNRTQENWSSDVSQIRSDLMEQISVPGAFCRDYESFKTIYRFLERGMQRSNQKVCVILMSMVDQQGNTVPPARKEEMMELLGTTLQRTLRMGDVFTRYSSCQYLVLAVDVTEDLAEMIAQRIVSRFRDNSGDADVLVHYCFALRSAQVRPKDTPLL